MPPVNRTEARRPERSGRAGLAGAPAGALVGGRKVLAEKAALLGARLRRQGLPKVGAGVAGLLVLGILVWWLASPLGGGSSPSAGDSSRAPAAASASSAPDSRGALPLEGVTPLDFRPGDCFKDFDPEAPQSTVVACETGHSAQLIAVFRYQDTDSYPGLAALKDKGRETCRGAQLSTAASNYVLMQRNAYPSSTSWASGDRRVDCFVTADTGNVILESLLPQP